MTLKGSHGVQNNCGIFLWRGALPRIYFMPCPTELPSNIKGRNVIPTQKYDVLPHAGCIRGLKRPIAPSCSFISTAPAIGNFHLPGGTQRGEAGHVFLYLGSLVGDIKVVESLKHG